MKYYKKELVSNRLALPNGRRVNFTVVGDSDTGVLATEDPELIKELDQAVAKRRGGVIEIEAEVYDGLKKNPLAKPSPIKSLNAQSIRQLLSQKPNGEKPVAAAVSQPSAPMTVPKGLVNVSSRRRLKELAKEA